MERNKPIVVGGTKLNFYRRKKEKDVTFKSHNVSGWNDQRAFIFCNGTQARGQDMSQWLDKHINMDMKKLQNPGEDLERLRIPFGQSIDAAVLLQLKEL